MDLTVCDIAAGDHLRHAGILIVSTLEACDGHPVGAGPTVKSVEHALKYDSLSFRRGDSLRIDAPIIAGDERDDGQAEKKRNDLRTHIEA